AKRVMSDSERSFAKENCGAIFPVLDDQRLRAHGQNFLCGAGQVGLAGQHLRLGVVDQQHVHQLQGFGEFLRSAFNPVIHGIAAGKAHAVHLAPYVGLQSGLDVGQEQEVGVFVLVGDARLKSLKDIQIREVGFGFVEVVSIGPAPAKCFAAGALDAARVDVVLLEDFLLIGTEIFADDGDDAHLGEVGGGQGKVGGGSAQNIFYTARRRRDVIECNRTDYENTHAYKLPRTC